jgi:3-dehydrosphinganine reductase
MRQSPALSAAVFPPSARFRASSPPVKVARFLPKAAAAALAAAAVHAGLAVHTIINPMKNFQHKLALITGGSSGIGLALSKQLAQLGVDVWIAARRPDVLAQALVEIEKCRVNPEQRFGSIQLDISDENQVNHELSKFLTEVGTPDLLVNNAGLSRPGEILKQENEIFRWLINVNYLGTVYVTKCIAPAMVARKSGHIVNVSSGAAFVPLYGYGAYGATKYAMRGFSDVLREELKFDNIQVSVVMPADVETPQHEEEIKYLPAITKFLVGDNEVLMKPEAVAQEIIRGIRKNEYVILPGLFLKVYYFAYNLGMIGYWAIDLMLKDAYRKAHRPSDASKVKR